MEELIGRSERVCIQVPEADRDRLTPDGFFVGRSGGARVLLQEPPMHVEVPSVRVDHGDPDPLEPLGVHEPPRRTEAPGSSQQDVQSHGSFGRPDQQVEVCDRSRPHLVVALGDEGGTLQHDGLDPGPLEFANGRKGLAEQELIVEPRLSVHPLHARKEWVVDPRAHQVPPHEGKQPHRLGGKAVDLESWAELPPGPDTLVARGERGPQQQLRPLGRPEFPPEPCSPHGRCPRAPAPA